jgi:hypothetical protein
MSDVNHIPRFQFGRYSVEAWGHRSPTGKGETAGIWSIRVNDAFVGALSVPLDASGAEVLQRIKEWVALNLPR